MIRRVHALAAIAASITLVLTGVAPAHAGGPGRLATGSAALSPSSWDPGLIISNSIFFDGDAMSAGAIQQFLDARVPQCQPGATCLGNYRQDTQSKPAGLCAEYVGAAQETAATILAKVGLACSINPMVLLVILEKEQSLVTTTSASASRLDRAMGYYCPDDPSRPGWCHPDYAGFFNQVYNAAKQLQNYTQNPSRWNYRVGANNIYYNPNPACGSSSVYIQNQATANLYIYTPYQPNAATIAWKLGGGPAVSAAYPGCGAFGNINFFILFSQWFGSPVVPAGTASFVQALYLDVLGRPVSASESAYWEGWLARGGSRTALAYQILKSNESASIILTGLYQNILGRGPDAGGLAYWTNEFYYDRLREEDLGLQFITSPEYRAKTGGDSRALLAITYRLSLGREATSDELDYWVGQMPRMGEVGVLGFIWTSQEAQALRANVQYNRFVGHPADPEGLSYWSTKGIKGQGVIGLQVALLGSVEYLELARTRFP